MKKLNQRGAINMMFVALLIVLIAVGGFTAWRVLSQNNPDTEQKLDETQPTASQDEDDLIYSLEVAYESNDFKISLPKGYFYNDFSDSKSLFSGEQGRQQDSSVDERARVSMDIIALEDSLSEPIPQDADIETIILSIEKRLTEDLPESEQDSLLLRKLNNQSTAAKFSISTFRENVDAPTEAGIESIITELVFSADKQHVLELKVRTSTDDFAKAFATQQSIVESVEF